MLTCDKNENWVTTEWSLGSVELSWIRHYDHYNYLTPLTQPNVQTSWNLWQLDQLSWDESQVVNTAPPIGLNSTSWVELSPVGRCDQGFIHLQPGKGTLWTANLQMGNLQTQLWTGNANIGQNVNGKICGPRPSRSCCERRLAYISCCVCRHYKNTVRGNLMATKRKIWKL